MQTLFEHAKSGVPYNQLALEIVYHAGYPGNHMDQGSHPTCSVAVLEKEVFSKNPAEAADMIVSAATKMKWVDPHNKTITIDNPDSLKPGSEEQKWPPEDGIRTYDSQLFQLVALNDVGQHESIPKYYDDAVTYAFAPFGLHWPWKTRQQYWVDATTGKSPGAFEGLETSAVEQEAERLLAKTRQVVSIASDDPDDANVAHVATTSDLRKVLFKIKQDKDFPIMVAVNADNYAIGDEPKVLSYIDSLLGNIIPNHVITVENYDSQTDRVAIRNQWGKDFNRVISTHDLFFAMGGSLFK